jgi:hypothetical protein
MEFRYARREEPSPKMKLVLVVPRGLELLVEKEDFPPPFR